MNTASCLGCDKPVPPDAKRYQVVEEYPRMTVGYFCGKCWGIIRAITSVRA